MQHSVHSVELVAGRFNSGSYGWVLFSGVSKVKGGVKVQKNNDIRVAGAISRILGLFGMLYGCIPVNSPQLPSHPYNDSIHPTLFLS